MDNYDRYHILTHLNCHSFHLTYCEHKDYYLSVEDYLRDESCTDQIPSDVRERMIDKNVIWRLQIYPRTPIVFSVLYGDTLDCILEQLAEFIKDNNE